MNIKRPCRSLSKKEFYEICTDHPSCEDDCPIWKNISDESSCNPEMVKKIIERTKGKVSVNDLYKAWYDQAKV